MAIRNYTTGKTKINFSINTCPPKMTNDEYNARCDKFDKFVLDIKTKASYLFFTSPRAIYKVPLV